MATVYQSSAGMSNANKITISMWCRAHTVNDPSESGDYFQLLEFGDPDGATNAVSNSIGLITNSTGDLVGNALLCQFAGVKDSVDGLDVCSSNLTTGSSGTISYPGLDPIIGAGNPWPFVTNSGAGGTKFTPYCTAQVSKIGSAVSPGRWFHLLVAVDASNATTYSAPTNSNKLYVVLNGVIQPVIGASGRSSVTDGSFIASMDNSTYGVFTSGPFRWVGGLDNEYLTLGNIPAFAFDLNGKEIGIPSQVASPNKNTQLLDMADVQIWVGKYIDPTNLANFEKFVSISGGRGFPASPYGAAIAFGNQTYLFTGNSSTFYDNQGTGGVFAKSGTLSNISGPSY